MKKINLNELEIREKELRKKIEVELIKLRKIRALVRKTQGSYKARKIAREIVNKIYQKKLKVYEKKHSK